MLLATRCPFCETVFRLQPAQLALRRGLVRCGHCQEVFDASSSLYRRKRRRRLLDRQTRGRSGRHRSAIGRAARRPEFQRVKHGIPWAPAPEAVVSTTASCTTRATCRFRLCSTDAGVAVTPTHQDEPPVRSPINPRRTPAHPAPVTPGTRTGFPAARTASSRSRIRTTRPPKKRHACGTRPAARATPRLKSRS